MPVPNTSTSPFPSISDLQISPEGACKQLSHLNSKKACGPDEILPRVLKEVSQPVSTWLSFIFQQSYECSVFPFGLVQSPSYGNF